MKANPWGIGASAMVLAVVTLANLDQAWAQGVSLAEAARAGDRTAVRALLTTRAEPSLPGADGTTALHWAVRHDDRETVELLLDAGADSATPNRYGVTPLYLACQNGNAAIIERLLKAGADPNAASLEGETPLMTASRTGRVDAVTVLLAHGANPNDREAWRGQTALMWAAAEGHTGAVEALIDAGADTTARSTGGFTPLLFAVRAGRIDTVRALLAKGGNPNDTIAPPQSPSVRTPSSATSAATTSPPRTDTSDEDRLKTLFRVFDTGSRARGRTGPGTTALIMAIMNGHFELASVLVDHGADPDAAGPGWTALHQLAWTRRPPIQHGLPPPVQTGTMDSLALARRLLERGADPNARMTREPADGARNVLNRLGSTPFLQAAKLGDLPYMHLLLDFHADPAVTTDEGATALMAAAGVGIWHTGESAGTNEEAFEAVKLCYEAGNDVNAVDANGDTALHGAALRGANDIVRFLVEKGAKLDVVNLIGWTPWLIADGVFYPNTYNRQPETAALLLELGANPTLGKRRDVDLPPTEALASDRVPPSSR